MKKLIAVLLLMVVVRAEANDFYNGNLEVSRFGIEFQQFKGGDGPLGTQGGMLGVRDSRYVGNSKHFSLGAAGYFGTPTGGAFSKDNLFYAGAIAGLDMAVVGIFNLSIDMLAGYGYGSSDSLATTGQSIVLQPSIGAGFTLVNGWRATFEMGYLYMPSASGFSNRTYGIRLEHKTESHGSTGVNY